MRFHDLHVHLHKTRDAFNESEHPRGQPNNAGQFAKSSQVHPAVHEKLVGSGFKLREGGEAHYEHPSGNRISFEPPLHGYEHAYGFQHRNANGELVTRNYGTNAIAKSRNSIAKERKNVIPDFDDEVTPEVIAQLPPQARTPEGAERYVRSLLDKLARAGKLTLYHEIPNNAVESVKARGLNSSHKQTEGSTSGEGTWAAINAPSEFVTTPVKTEVRFKLPPRALSDLKVDDQTYGGLNKLSPEQMALLRHPDDLRGAYVAMPEGIPASWITSVKLVKKGATHDRVYVLHVHLHRGAQDAGTSEGAVKAAKTRAAHAGHHAALTQSGWQATSHEDYGGGGHGSTTTYSHPQHAGHTIESNASGKWRHDKPTGARSSQSYGKGNTTKGLAAHVASFRG